MNQTTPTKSPYGPIITQLLEINKTRREANRSMPHNMLGMLSQPTMLAEIYSIHVGAGRGSFKTQYVIETADEYTLVLVGNPGLRKSILNRSFTEVTNNEAVTYRLRESQVMDVDDIKANRWNQSEIDSPYRTAIFDSWSMFLPKVNEKSIFKWLAPLVVEEPTIILLG